MNLIDKLQKLEEMIEDCAEAAQNAGILDVSFCAGCDLVLAGSERIREAVGEQSRLVKPASPPMKVI